MTPSLSVPMEVGTAWVILVFAGLFEVGWAIGLKYTQGFTRFWPSVATACSMGLSVWLLGVAVRTLPLGTAYAVWTGIGTVGTVVFGVVLFQEPTSTLRLASVGLVLAGIAALKITHSWS